MRINCCLTPEFTWRRRVPTHSALFDVLPGAAVTPYDGYREGAGAYREGEDHAVIQVLSRNGIASVGLVKQWLMTRIKEFREEIHTVRSNGWVF